MFWLWGQDIQMWETGAAATEPRGWPCTLHRRRGDSMVGGHGLCQVWGDPGHGGSQGDKCGSVG